MNLLPVGCVIMMFLLLVLGGEGRWSLTCSLEKCHPEPHGSGNRCKAGNRYPSTQFSAFGVP